MCATAGRNILLFLALMLLGASCRTEKPAEQKNPEPETVIIRPKPAVLSMEQRAELGFPPELIGRIELSAGAEAEPFFVTEVFPSENLKGEKGFEEEKLAGFSVRTTQSDDLIRSYRSGLRVKGYLIFKSQRGYGSLPDIVTIVKGNNSYDLLKLQRTEAASYKLDTMTIIAWLREQQKTGSFVVTGAGADWVEAKFVKPPVNMLAFARNVLAFAPDLRFQGPQTPEKLADQMKKNNGFFLVWD